jgi:hypothetical protein
MARHKRLTFRRRMRACNLCGDGFLPESVFSRFCSRCRTEEIIHFAEWLPDAESPGIPRHEPPDSLREYLIDKSIA